MKPTLNERQRLEKASNLAKTNWPRAGVNKQQELTRLIYEISKRENIDPDQIIEQNSEPTQFNHIKQVLLNKRFPFSASTNELKNCFLPKVYFEDSCCHKTRSDNFLPKNIFIESTVANSELAENFRQAFPLTKIVKIDSLKNFLRENKRPTLADYNTRTDNVFIVDEKYDFYKRCPCTISAVNCGYHILNLGFGCIYECSYCYLQGYSNSPGLIFPANFDAFFEQFNTYLQSAKTKAWQQGSHFRLGTGEFCDSLMLDHITKYSESLIAFFKHHPQVLFELKTKSANVENLLSTEHIGNIVIAWSINPQNFIEQNELYTASLLERLQAARKCQDAGYLLAFHFDPIVYFDNWEKKYKEVIELMFEYVDHKHIAWMSLGTLRFHSSLKRIIENRFPENAILNGELLKGYDDKLRYPETLRLIVYKKMLEMLNKHHKNLPIYLCMEDKKIWQQLNLEMPFK
ncbi:MAG: spore photoproduct lyase family protein [Pseudomonadota bacterium]